MQKSILILGPQASGKTIKFRTLVNNYLPKFTKDGATDIGDIQNLQDDAIKHNTYCLVTSQLRIGQISFSLLQNFEVINLHNPM